MVYPCWMMRQRYIVETGNFTASIDLPTNWDTATHMEAATRVFEAIFGEKDVKDFDIISITDEDGTNLLKVEVKDFEEGPEFEEFAGVLVDVYKEGGTEENHVFMLASQVFMNAALPQYVNTALAYEKDWAVQVDEDIEHI